MAQKVIVELVDDLDGTVSPEISTVSFGLDGVEYEIDLTEANAKALRGTLEQFVGPARRTGGRLKRGAGTATARQPANREQTQAIREWARQHGYDLADRGRIPANIVEAFNDAHAGSSKSSSGAVRAPAFSH